MLTYPDSLGGTIADTIALLRGPLDGLFSGVHILPPFPSSGDRGFAPITYDSIDPSFGTWADIEDLAQSHAVLLDVMVNHISRHSDEFQMVLREGLQASTSSLFITPDDVWPPGGPPDSDLARLFLRRRTGPFSTFITADGEPFTVWTTFGDGDVSEQVDLDLRSDAARGLLTRWFDRLATHGVAMVRLDAVGYVVKKAGTSCFMVEPEIWEFLDWASAVAARLGLTILPEVHDTRDVHRRLVDHGLWTYDFVLPGLVLHALTTGEAERLAAHLTTSPSRQVTTLDSHDGIPVLPDLAGILRPSEMRRLADLTLSRGGNINRIISPQHAQDDVDAHQLNITYFSVLGEDVDRYLVARAIQLFTPGIPQVYYLGLLAGSNDVDTVVATGEGRAINRRNLCVADVMAALDRPIVRRLLTLIRLRNTHPAFDGEVTVGHGAHDLDITWRLGDASCRLEVDLSRSTTRVLATDPEGVESVVALDR